MSKQVERAWHRACPMASAQWRVTLTTGIMDIHGTFYFANKEYTFFMLSMHQLQKWILPEAAKNS